MSCSRARTKPCSSTSERPLSLELIFSDAPTAEALSDDELLAAMARFEGALAVASAGAGVVSQEHARLIEQVCARARFDARQLAKDARSAGTLAIPFVRELTAQVAATSAQAARYVHHGATSQDLIDTAVVLCVRAASARIAALTVRLGQAIAQIAQRHSGTPMLARTLLQPAAPVPFGWKAAMWLAPLTRSLPAFRAAARAACVLQFGGAAGTLSAYRGKGEAVAAALSRELDLPYAGTWHSGRDGFARLGSEVATLTGLAAKVARDLSLLMQPEIGEAAEPTGPGRGGSSSLPHKRNPALCLLALEAAQRAPWLAATLLAGLSPEHERGLGQWQGQWFTLRALLLAASSALAAMAEAVEGLEIRADAMRANLERTNGLVYAEAVAVRLSRAAADRLCEEAMRQGKHLRDVMRADAEVARMLPAGELDGLFRPQNAFGSAQAMIERTLASWQAVTSPAAAP